MSDLTDHTENKLGRAVGRGEAWAPAQTWLALFSTNPGEAGGGTELAGSGYVRVRIYQDGATAPFWQQVGGTNIWENSHDVEFPAATAQWDTIVYAAICDAAAGGNVISYKALSTPATVLVGQTFVFSEGDFEYDFR